MARGPKPGIELEQQIWCASSKRKRKRECGRDRQGRVRLREGERPMSCHSRMPPVEFDWPASVKEGLLTQTRQGDLYEWFPRI